MTVVRFPASTVERLVGESKEKIVEALERMGMPSGVYEGELEVELTPNRLDLLGMHSMSHAVKVFLGKEKGKFFSAKGTAGELRNEKPRLRPYIRAFAVKGVKEGEFLYENLIQIQEKLHFTLGRKRKKVAIGIHDLSAVEFPLRYAEVEDERFVPLGWEREASIKEILDGHEKGREYAHLVGNGPYPMLYDAKGVISFPPIINSERTKISEGTRDFLVDITGTEEKAVKEVERILAVELALAGGEIYSININGEISPDLSIQEMPVDVKAVEDILGVSVEAEAVERMGHVLEGSKVKIAQNRYDILTLQDLAEEYAVALGYGSIPREVPEVHWFGKPNAEVEFTVRVKRLLTTYGLVESYGFFLSPKELSLLISPEEEVEETLNPASSEASTLRASVLSSLLKVHSVNKRRGLPQGFFEVGRVYSKSKQREFLEVGVSIGDRKTSIDEVAGIAKRFLFDVKVKAEFTQEENRIGETLKELGVKEGVFLTNRSGALFSEKGTGVLGEINPEVLEALGIDFPVSAFIFRFL